MKKLTDNEAMNSEGTSNSRRDFLKKAGKFAVYTPPAVMMLMKPSFAGNEHKGSWMGRPDHSYKPTGGSHSYKPMGGNHSYKPRNRRPS